MGKKKKKTLSEVIQEHKMDEIFRLEEFLRWTQVVLPEGLQDTRLNGIRRPLILFRGKPITEVETIQLITGEEALFQEN